MLLIESKSTNPYFNIATEDYLLHGFTNDILFLYIDSPSIICGKHQNALAEINYSYVVENEVAVVRRLSGGGTVYHDFGNLNFCFIVNATEGKLVDFKKHTLPLINAIASFGVTPTLGVRNDIIIDGLKVSGNAEHVWKSRVLHHGTLLFNSNLNHLEEAIRVTPERFEDKSVKSKRSLVGNIRDFINIDISIEQFKKRVIEIVSEFYLLEMSELQTIDLAEIQKLVESKYTTWQWNFGYSPKYRFKNSIMVGDVEYSIDLLVDKGEIIEAKFYKNGTLNELIECQLIGCNHRIEPICRRLNNSISELTIHRLFFNKS